MYQLNIYDSVFLFFFFEKDYKIILITKKQEPEFNPAPANLKPMKKTLSYGQDSKNLLPSKQFYPCLKGESFLKRCVTCTDITFFEND